MEQTNRLIQLLESIDYPHEISPKDLYAQLADQYSTTPPGALTSVDFSSSPTAQFVDWLLNNVSAESNWPGYNGQVEYSISLNHADRGLDEEEAEGALSDLDQQHWQLQ